MEKQRGEEKREQLRASAATEVVLSVGAAAIVACCAAGVHCYEYWECSVQTNPTTCVSPHANASVAPWTGYCSFVNIVSLSGDALYNQTGQDLEDLLRGICLPGERMHMDVGTGDAECVPHRSYPDALERSIMDPDASEEHMRACGKWISAVPEITQATSWSFYDDAKWREAVQQAEATRHKGARLAADDMGKFRSRCVSAVVAGTGAIRKSAKQAYARLAAFAKPRTVESALTALGYMAGHYCDTPVTMGIGRSGNGFQLAFSEGAKYDNGTLAEMLYAVEGGARLRQHAEAANAHVNAYAWSSPWISNAELLWLADGALSGGRTAEGATAGIGITAQLDGFVHLAKTGRWDDVDGFLHGVAAVCASTLASSVDRVGGVNVRRLVARIAARKPAASALGRLQTPPVELGSVEPLLEMDNATEYNASAITLSQLVGSPVGNAETDCLEFTRRLFPDRVERQHFELVVPSGLYDRLETLATTLKAAVAQTLRTNEAIRDALVDPDAVATAVEAVRLRIPGAPAGTWAGVARDVPQTDLSSASSVLEMALVQARAVFLDRVQALALNGAEICSGPPAYDALGTNAYIYPCYKCSYYLLGMLRRPFADERYDDVSLATRIGYVFAHEAAHVELTATPRAAGRASLLHRYDSGVYDEALADVVAATALVRSGLANTSDVCSNVGQLWCGVPASPLAQMALDLMGTPPPIHPGVNERGDLLCATLHELEASGALQ